MTTKTASIDRGTHIFSYEYPHQFSSPQELIHFLYDNQGVDPTLITSLLASNQIDLLIEVTCILLTRIQSTTNPLPTPQPSPSATPPSSLPSATPSSTAFLNLPAGTRFSELEAIDALGVNKGRIPISNRYFGPLVALTGCPTALTDIQKLRPDLIDFFRILRSSTTWTAQSFRDAILNSEYAQFKAFLDSQYSFLSPAERHMMLATKSYELAFYVPFIPAHSHPFFQQSLSSTPPSTSSTETAPHSFVTPPTLEQLTTQQFDLEQGAREFLYWTGLNDISTQYTQQLNKFLGTDLVLSWQYIISNILTAIKHFYTTHNLNFMLWIYQLFFPRYLYTQIPKDCAIKTIKSLHEKTTAITQLKQSQFQELQTYLMNTTTPSHEALSRLKSTHQHQLDELEQKGAENTSPYSFILTTRAIVVGGFICALNEIGLEKFYFVEQIDHVKHELTTLKRFVALIDEQQRQRDELIQSSQSTAIQLLSSSSNLNLHESTPTPALPSTIDTTPPLAKLKKKRLSVLASRQSLNNARSKPQHSSSSDDDGDPSDVMDATPRSRLKQQRLESRSKSRSRRSSSTHPTPTPPPDTTNENIDRIQEQIVPVNTQDPQIKDFYDKNGVLKPILAPNGRSKSDLILDIEFNDKLIAFYTARVKYALVINELVVTTFQYNFALPSHLIAIYLCAMLMNDQNTISSLARYGIASTSSNTFVDNSGADPLLTYDIGQYQRVLRRNFLPPQQPLGNDATTSQPTQTIPFFLHPQTPAYSLSESPLVSQSHTPNLTHYLQFSVHAVKAYFKHCKTRYGTLDHTLRLLGRRSLAMAITRLVSIAKKPFLELTFNPPIIPNLPLDSNSNSATSSPSSSPQTAPNPDFINLHQFIIDTTTSTSRCTLQFFEFLLQLNCPFTVDSEKFHHSSNIIYAVMASPYLTETKRYMFLDLATKHCLKRFRLSPRVTMDIFYFILRATWSMRELCGPSTKLLGYIFTAFVDRVGWESRLRGKSGAKNIADSLKFLFSIELETQTARFATTTNQLAMIELSRNLMLQIYQYLLPQNSQATTLFFSTPAIINDAQLREALLRPIYSIGSTQSLEYLITLGYKLDPLDFTRLLSHSSRCYDHRDCVNVYSIMKAFYLHLYIVQAKNEAVNAIEFQQIEELESQQFSLNRTIKRNRSGFESFVMQRFPGPLYDTATLQIGLQTSEEMFQSMIDLSSRGKKFSNNEHLDDSELAAYFRNAARSLDYLPSTPQVYQQLCCNLDSQAEMGTLRLQKIMSNTSTDRHDDDAADGGYNDNNDEDQPRDEDEEMRHSANRKKELEKQLFVLDATIFEALSHYQHRLCPTSSSKSTLIEFILIYRKNMENFFKHFVGSLLIYRAAYSFQSPLLYNILRCLIPRLDLFPAQMSHLLIDKFRGFDFIQQFQLQSLIDSYLEDVISSTLQLRPTQLQFLLTPPHLAVQQYSLQRERKKGKEEQEVQAKASGEQEQLESRERSGKQSAIQALQDSRDHLEVDDYDLITMSHEEREKYRLQISELIQALIVTILITRSKKHPNSMKPHAPSEYSNLCLDSIKPLYHFLKFIPLPSITRYERTVQSFNYHTTDSELLDQLKPSPPGIRPQFLFFLMQTLPVSSPTIFNDLLDLYVQQNGIIFNTFYHFHSLTFPHLFINSCYDVTYYRYFTYLLKAYSIQLTTFTDALWRNIIFQAIQHCQYPLNNNLEFLHFIAEYISMHQAEVNEYRQDYLTAAHELTSNKLSTDSKWKPYDALKQRLQSKWKTKSMVHIQPFSQTTDLGGNSLLLSLAGMGLPVKLCLSVLSILDQLHFAHQPPSQPTASHQHIVSPQLSPTSLLESIQMKSIRPAPPISSILPQLTYHPAPELATDISIPHPRPQNKGPQLPDLPLPTPPYPTLQHPTEDHNQTSQLPIPLAPFTTLFHKDNSGRTLLHHLVEHTELTPSLLESLACSAVDPINHYNFGNLYATSTPQLCPYLGTVPSDLDISGFQRAEGIAKRDALAARKALRAEQYKLLQQMAESGQPGPDGKPITLPPFPSPDDEDEDEDDDIEAAMPSVAMITEAQLMVLDHQPRTPMLFTLDSNQSAGLENHGEECYPPSNDKLDIIDALQMFHAIANRQILSQYIGVDLDDHTLHSLKQSLVAPKDNDPHTTAQINALLYRTIYSTDSPLLFWLSYIKYYCQLADPQQSANYLQSLQPAQPNHYETIRENVLKRQIRHRFPLSIQTTPEHLEVLIQEYVKASKSEAQHRNANRKKDQFNSDDSDDSDSESMRKSKHNNKQQRSTYSQRKQIKMENRQRRAIVGFGAAVLGLAVAVAGYFWLTSSGHQDDDEMEPEGEVARYEYSQQHHDMVRSGKKKKRR